MMPYLFLFPIYIDEAAYSLLEFLTVQRNWLDGYLELVHKEKARLEWNYHHPQLLKQNHL